MAEVDDAFDVGPALRVDRERWVERARARVAHVVLNDGVAARQAVGRGVDAHVAGEAAAAEPEHFAVPLAGSR